MGTMTPRISATLALAALLCCGCYPICRAPTWLDANGNHHGSLGMTNRKATVLLFISPDCPMSNGYAPEMARLADEYEPRGVGFFAVHSDPRVKPAVARAHAREHGIRFPVLMDDQQILAHNVGATMTPQAAVMDDDGRVVYLGRIDNVYYGWGKRRERPTHHDVRDTLDAVLAGKEITRRIVEPSFGCEIPPPLGS